MLQRSIHDVNCRVAAQQERWLKLQQVIAERAAEPEMECVPGGRTGLIVLRKRAVGRGKAVQIVEEAAVDTVTLNALLAVEAQAARELGQWTVDRTAVKDEEYVEKLDMARRRILAMGLTFKEALEVDLRLP